MDIEYSVKKMYIDAKVDKMIEMFKVEVEAFHDKLSKVENSLLSQKLPVIELPTILGKLRKLYTDNLRTIKDSNFDCFPREIKEHLELLLSQTVEKFIKLGN